MREERPAGESPGRRWMLWAALAGAAALLVLAYLFRQSLGEGFAFLGSVQARKEEFRAWIDSYGAWGPLVFIALQVGQVVFSPIPGELTGFLGGYVYGAWLAAAYSTVGLTLGSWLAFAIGRRLGRPFVERLMSRKVLDKFDFLIGHRGALLAFVFFSIPGFPKDYMCYLLGLSPLRTRTFLLVSLFGRIPGTIVLGLQGANLYEEKYGLFFGILVVLIVGAVVIAYAREPLRLWLRAKSEAKGR